jgi:uncharacterized protein DUF4397
MSNRRQTLRNGAAIALAAVAAWGVGCQAHEEKPRVLASPKAAPPAPVRTEETSLVRVIHAIPGASPADVYADDVKVFSAVEYKAVSDYKNVRDNQVTFKLRTAGQPGEPLTENHETLADGSCYTVVVMPGERGKAAELKVLSDEKDAPPEGKARVRVVNAAADAGKLEVTLRGREKPLVGGLHAADDTGYHDVTPADTTLVVRDKDKKRVVAEATNVAFASGKSYTVLIMGRVAGKPKAEVLVVEDGREGVPRRSAASLPPS